MSRFQQASTLVGDESNDLAEVIYLAGRYASPLKKRRIYERAYGLWATLSSIRSGP